ncbi:MAG: lysophospholipase, partial [Bacilli bacterium]|nr:lysophospholipase [Bacilli bacterium]
IIAINLALYEYCKEKSITYIDIFKHLIDEKGNLRREYTFEGLHINYEGYQIISELLLPYLES